MLIKIQCFILSGFAAENKNSLNEDNIITACSIEPLVHV